MADGLLARRPFAVAVQSTFWHATPIFCLPPVCKAPFLASSVPGPHSNTLIGRARTGRGSDTPFGTRQIGVVLPEPARKGDFIRSCYRSVNCCAAQFRMAHPTLNEGQRHAALKRADAKAMAQPARASAPARDARNFARPADDPPSGDTTPRPQPTERIPTSLQTLQQITPLKPRHEIGWNRHFANAVWRRLRVTIVTTQVST